MALFGLYYSTPAHFCALATSCLPLFSGHVFGYRFWMVQARVLGSSHGNKIFKPIVRWIAVNMMNVLIRGKGSVGLFPNISVFLYKPPTRYPNFNVAIWIRVLPCKLWMRRPFWHELGAMASNVLSLLSSEKSGKLAATASAKQPRWSPSILSAFKRGSRIFQVVSIDVLRHNVFVVRLRRNLLAASALAYHKNSLQSGLIIAIGGALCHT